MAGHVPDRLAHLGVRRCRLRDLRHVLADPLKRLLVLGHASMDASMRGSERVVAAIESICESRRGSTRTAPTTSAAIVINGPRRGTNTRGTLPASA